jgi:hypothetical protein
LTPEDDLKQGFTGRTSCRLNPGRLADKKNGMFGLLLLLISFLSLSAWTGEPTFGKNDLETVFFVNKSDDRNRVDYGLRLDSECHPKPDDDALFFYWREFENSPPVRIHDAGLLDGLAYGISTQRTVQKDAHGAEYLVRIKHFDRDITIKISREVDGKCMALASMTIAKVRARLESAFVQLGKVFSVEYVELHGKRVENGVEVAERLSQ